MQNYFADKGMQSQNYGFSSSHVWRWKLDYTEGWVPKNWCFWIGIGENSWVTWTARRSNQSILNEINPEYSLEGLMLKLKLRYFGHLMWRANSLMLMLRPWCWERLGAGEGDDRGWDGWMASPTQWTWIWASSRSWWRTEKPGVLQSMGSQRVGHDWVTEWQTLCLWGDMVSPHSCTAPSEHDHFQRFAGRLTKGGRGGTSE